MKTRLSFLLLYMIVLTAGFVHAQGLLNKIKKTANQEVNKLEKGTTPAPQTNEPEPIRSKLSANVTRTVLIKLNDDEIFAYGESCIDLGLSNDQVSFTLKKKSTGTCISYKNGTRKPIACPNPYDECKGTTTSLPPCGISKLRPMADGEEFKKYVTTKTATKEMPAMSVSEGQIDDAVKIAEAAMTPEEKADFEKEIKAQKAERDGKGISTKGTNISIPESQTINFNGKSYPVFKVTKFYLSPGNKHFYAEVLETGESKEFKIITSASTAFLKSPHDIEDLFATPDNSEFAVYGRMGTDLKYTIVTSKGKTYPVDGDMSAAWYSPTGNHLMMISRISSKNVVYKDGNEVKGLDENAYYEPCDLYFSSDGSGITTFKGNKLKFYDGDFFNYPLEFTTFTTGGKLYYKWLGEDSNEVVIYQKPN